MWCVSSGFDFGGDASNAIVTNRAMSQLTQIAQTLHNLANENRTTPDDIVKAGTERGDAFERIIEGLDAQMHHAVADAQGCADIIATTQRLKEVMDARAAAFRATIVDVVEARCRAVDAEYEALVVARGKE